VGKLEFPDETTQGESTNLLTLDEVVLRILMAGKINRKAYLYLTKALYNSIFSNRFDDQQNAQVFQLLEGIAKGRIQIFD
jgi:hypothetical protein